jgi:hypothetical protein
MVPMMGSRRTIHAGSLLLILLSLQLGCGVPSRLDTIDDVEWSEGRLRYVVNPQHFKTPLVNFHGHGPMTRQEWYLVSYPCPGEGNERVTKRQFARRRGESYKHNYSLIRGSDLLIYHYGGWPGEAEGQWMLFDPNTGTNVSRAVASPTLFSRSRRMCATMVKADVRVVDTLSARTGEPKVLARPPWAEVLDKLKFGGIKAVLTEDGQRLVLLPHIASPSYVTSSNFVVEVHSSSGSKTQWSIPLERNWEKFVDAEVVDGEVLILSRRLMANGADEEVKLINMNGETVHSQKISAFTAEGLWDPSRHEILFAPSEFEPTEPKSPRRFYVWNYASNSVTTFRLRK